MAKYNFVDSAGLNHLIDKIKELYTTKASTEELDSALRNLISAEETRASGAESTIQSNLDSEVSRAREEELRIEGEASQDRERIENKFDSKVSEEYNRAVEAEGIISGNLSEEITRATTREGELANEDLNLASEIQTVNTDLSGRIDSLDLSKVSGVRVNGIDVVNPITKVADFNFSGIVQASIQVVDELPDPEDEDFSKRPQNSILYITRADHIIWQWNDTLGEYVEAGKFNVLLVDELPETGDPQVLYILSSNHSINIYVGGDDPEKKWQEISGKDKELRAEFEEFKGHHHDISDIDDISDLHLDWGNIDDKPNAFTPAPHSHVTEYDLRYYVRGESGGPLSPQDLEDHENASHPHPTLEASINESLSQKASLSLLSSHTTNRENPHQVTKEQVGLGNVDNTSDADKPISTATQTALNDKASKEYVDEGLLEKVGYDDIIDNLYTHQSNQALSAEQGTQLDAKIERLENDTISLVRVLRFKGKVDSYEELIQIENPEIGDAYQINSSNGQSADGEMFAYNGVINPSIYEEPEEPIVEPGEEGEGEEEGGEELTPEINPEDYGWVKIIASATDISQWAATLAEVHQIIDFYDN